MKKLMWASIVIVAVALSVGLGLRLGSSGGGGPKVPVKTTDSPGAADLGDESTLGAGGAEQNGPSDRDETSNLSTAVEFVIDPAEPQAGAEVTLSDQTTIRSNDQILASEWKVEGPGLEQPIELSGQDVQVTLPAEGVYRVMHRLRLQSIGLTDWAMQVVAVAPGEEPDVQLQPQVITDASGAIDLWTEAGQVRFRINSEALGEEPGHIENMRAKITYASGESASMGPGAFRMDIPLVIGLEHTRVSSFSISGKLPSGRLWEQTFIIQ